MNRIVYPRERFLQDYRQLREESSPFLLVPVVPHCGADNVELLVPPGPQTGSAPGQRLRVELAQDIESLPPGSFPASVQGLLLLGQGRQRGEARGFVAMDPGRFEAVDELRLVGPGMARIALTPRGETALAPAPLDDRWSRTQSALTPAAWQRLVGLRFAIIGVGRTGSTMGRLLARVGVRHLTLIDPDSVQRHNLGESDGLTEADVGRRKVEALAEALRALRPELVVETVVASITNLQALRAAAAADLVCCTPDHNSARLAASFLTLFNKPMLDIGTGIFREGPHRIMGADARLSWPGRCLLCVGGLREEREARRLLGSADAEAEFLAAPREWRRERAGSLASLNGLAASAGMRLVEDFVEGRLRENGTWVRLSFSEAGQLSVSHPATTASPVSRRCACGAAGLGEDGLPRVVEMLRAETGDETRMDRSV